MKSNKYSSPIVRETYFNDVGVIVGVSVGDGVGVVDGVGVGIGGRLIIRVYDVVFEV